MKRIDKTFTPWKDGEKTSDAAWRNPKLWDDRKWEECTECGWRGPAAHDAYDICPQCDGKNLVETRPRVLCTADVFEDDPAIDVWRLTLVFDLIPNTPNIDWLIATKHPANVNGWQLPDNIKIVERNGDDHEGD